MPVEFRIQMEGIAAALRHPALHDAIAAGRERRIALTLMLWSGADPRRVAVPWRLLATRGGSRGRRGRRSPVPSGSWQAGGTALGAWRSTTPPGCSRVIPFAATRQVIDISGDGVDNVTGTPASARDRAVAQGITINGLPITKGSQLLPIYYQTEVIGGRDAFIEPAPISQAFEGTISAQAAARDRPSRFREAGVAKRVNGGSREVRALQKKKARTV